MVIQYVSPPISPRNPDPQLNLGCPAADGGGDTYVIQGVSPPPVAPGRPPASSSFPGATSSATGTRMTFGSSSSGPPIIPPSPPPPRPVPSASSSYSPPPSSSSGSNLDSGFYQPPSYPGYTGSLNTGSSNSGAPPPDSGQNGGMSDSSMGNSASG